MPGFEWIGEEERKAVNEVFDNGAVLFRHGFANMRKGSYKVKEFEEAFSKYLGVRYAHAVTSGTAALKVGLKALDIKEGDEVITQSHTFVATVEAIIECGATPIITEIDWSLNMDPQDLEKKITSKTKAIIPVHMFGAAAEMDRIMAIANAHAIPVLEDTAQGLGGFYQGKPLGTIGRIGTFSFDHGKIMTTGEGGMLVTNDESIYLRAKAYSDHGHEDNPAFPRGEDTRSFPGFNYRMMELQGAIGLVQLRKLEKSVNMQKQNKDNLKKTLMSLSGFSNIKFRHLTDPIGETGDALIFFMENSDQAKVFSCQLQQQGITFKNLPGALNWHFAGTWDHIFSKHPMYQQKNLEKYIWPQSSCLLRRAIALPIYLNMSKETINVLVDKIQDSLSAIIA